MKPSPPYRMLQFLRWFCREDYIEEIEGDLVEVFEKQYEKSPVRARRKFSWSVTRYFRPEFMRSFIASHQPNPIVMFHHNLLLTYRNFRRHRSSFFINLLGLSSGLALTMLIYLWVNNELNVDKFLKKDGQLFQVLQNTHRTNGIETIEATPGPLAKALVEEIPEVEYSASVIPTTFNASKGVISIEDNRIRSTAQYVTRDFFKIFSYRIIHGDKDQVLSKKREVVISEELAVKLFGSTEDAVGKEFDWNSQSVNGVCIVSAVFELPPPNATNHFDLLLNYEWFEEVHPITGWGNSSPRTYVLLKEGVSRGEVHDKIKDFIKLKDKDLNTTLFLQRYSDRYLYGRYENGQLAGGRIEYVRLFSIIAVLTLLIACINFMNLSTARSLRKVKEVGIKKVIGAGRKTLFSQYLLESIAMAFLSLIVAVLLVVIFLPRFNSITGQQLSLDFDTNMVWITLGATLLTGIVSGGYPSLFLSGFNTVNALKGRLNTSFKDVWARKGLVVFQFTISVMLIIAVWVVYKQIEFIQSKNLGYERDHVIYFNIEKMSETFLSELKDIPGVINAGGGNITTGRSPGGTGDVHWDGKNPDDKTFFSTLWMSYDLIETLDMEIVAGHAFSRDFGSHDQIIFNEAAISRMELDNPVGTIVRMANQERKIVGVVKDFHFESLYEEVKPCALLLAPIQYAPRISVRIKTGTERVTIDQLEKVCKKHNPDLTFDFKYMDDDYQLLYASERRVADLSGYFAVFAVLISCLGIFGLAAYKAERRTKEIGIRKVFGSGVWDIIHLLSSDFTKMVIVAIFIALPLSYLFAKSWLEEFAYRVELEPGVFIGAGLMVLFVAWFTVGLQTVKAARISPAECLKDE